MKDTYKNIFIFPALYHSKMLVGQFCFSFFAFIAVINCPTNPYIPQTAKKRGDFTLCAFFSFDLTFLSEVGFLKAIFCYAWAYLPT